VADRKGVRRPPRRSSTGGETGKETRAKVTPPEPEAPTPKRRAAPLEPQLKEFFAGITIAVGLFDTYDAQVLARQTDALAGAYARLARENATVDRVLRGILQGSTYSEVIMVTAATAVPILAHHDLLPTQLTGFTGMMNGNPKPPPSAEQQAEEQRRRQGGDTPPTVD
jgi:hypothetical protein